MAHQTHNIPWNVLANNLEFISANPCQLGGANLHLRSLPDQVKQLNFFAEAFARNVCDQARRERAKYPEKYDSLAADDIILHDELVRKLLPVVHKLRQAKVGPYWDTDRKPPRPSVHGDWPLPHDKRKASAFLMPYRNNSCYDFLTVNGDAFFNVEIVKALILEGEMDAVLRICAQPSVDLKSWYSECECSCGVSGPSSSPHFSSLG